MKKYILLLLNLFFYISISAQFGPQQPISTNSAIDIYPCDVNGDDDIDLVAANYVDDSIGWYENLNVLGYFGTRQIIRTNAEQVCSVHAIDIDGVGDLDVISGSQADDKIA